MSRLHISSISARVGTFSPAPSSTPEAFQLASASVQIATIDALLRPDPHVPQVASVVRDAASRLNTAWRMTEGNTCYRGGKPGLSDVFAASLWAADYMLLLAS